MPMFPTGGNAHHKFKREELDAMLPCTVEEWEKRRLNRGVLSGYSPDAFAQLPKVYRMYGASRVEEEGGGILEHLLRVIDEQQHRLDSLENQINDLAGEVNAKG